MINQVNCKCCGNVIEVKPKKDWPLLCDGCVKAGHPLPAGYEHLEGTKHDNSKRGNSG